MVYCVGLTGGIASGKTSIAALFSKLGIEVIHADIISRELTQKDQPAFKKIVKHYGIKILNSDKQLNRSQLRDIIFSNPRERKWLESLLHPLIRQEIKKRVTTCTTSYCIVEIPLLISKDNYPYINRVLLITSPTQTQISRIMERDQCSREQAHAILSTQPNMNLRLRNTHDVVVNDLSIDDLAIKVNKLHHNYINISKRIK